MKKFLLFAIAFLPLALLAQTDSKQTKVSQPDDKYLTNFNKALINLDSSWMNPVKMRETINMFERLAAYKKDDWLPLYYQGLGLVQLSWSSDAKERPTILDAAEKVIKAAQALSPDNSELVALEGYFYQAKIMINPMTNGQIYGPKSAMTLQVAAKLDPTNPRPEYLLGQNIYFTPEQWGGGMERARPHLEKAAELFKAFQPKGEFYPNWGEVPNRMILEGKMKN